MARTNNGTVKQGADGRWLPRVRWMDESGKPRDYKLPAQKTESKAWAAVHKKRDELATGGVVAVDSEKMTFAKLAEEYKKAKLFPAVIVNGKKIAGVRSYGSQMCALTALTGHFGKRAVRRITQDDLTRYRDLRLGTPTRYGAPRKIASVNRELELARAMFRFAISRRWLVFTPFTGSSVIQRSAETHRERVLTSEEYDRILAACRKPDKHGRFRRLQLLPLFIASVHTAARRAELITLKWRDVDFEAGTNGAMTVTSCKGKVERRRDIPLSPTLRTVLQELWEASSKEQDELVFGYRSTPKTVWDAVLRDAGIDDYRWHDNRHTGTTRMVDSVDNPVLVKKITGHTQDKTFERYYNPSIEKLATVTDALG